MAGRDIKQPSGPDATEDDQGFLGRWSKRKAEAKSEESPSPAKSDMVDKTEDDGSSPTTTDTSEPPAFDVGSLPDIDSLGPNSDFSMFMQTGVPSELKTKALRKLWRVKSSELANLDGLIDYGEDLTGSFKVVDHLKTAYEVGRGFLRDDDKKPVKSDENALDEQTPPPQDEPRIQDETTEIVDDVLPDEAEIQQADSQKAEKRDG